MNNPARHQIISPPLRAYGSEPTAHRGGDEGEGEKHNQSLKVEEF